MDQIVFGWIDYLLFVSLLGVSLLIGFYFGFFSKQDSANDYLLGGKSMGYIPVALSIIASTYSGITLMGVPTEVYFYGAYSIWFLLSMIPTNLFINYVSLPLFFNLGISNTYDYLEMRFSRKVKVFASCLYIFSLVTGIPLMIYGPVIALSQATGFSLNMTAPFLCAICIVYTTLGGVKAVVWTDTVQFVFTAGGLISVLTSGLRSVGGFSNMWKICGAGQRLDIFNFSPSFYSRNTFWNQTVAEFVGDVSYFAFGQKFVQRYFAIRKLEDSRKAVWINYVGTVLITASSVLTGLIIYAKYHDCDPISAKLIERSDQILPFYVMDTTKNLFGLSGLFFASVTSAGLSTMSAGINSLAGVIYSTFIESQLSENSELNIKATTSMKIISTLLGALTIGLIFVFDKMGTLLEMSTSIASITDGPIAGLFIMGMFFPWVGKKGALTGGFVSCFVMIWMAIGSQYYATNNQILYRKLPLSTENCSTDWNTSLLKNITINEITPSHEPFFIFRISFYYFLLLGTVIAITTGSIGSFVLKETDMMEVNPEHLVPSIRRFLPKKKYNEVPLTESQTEQKVSS